jgi:hypothetical protein
MEKMMVLGSKHGRAHTRANSRNDCEVRSSHCTIEANDPVRQIFMMLLRYRAQTFNLCSQQHVCDCRLRLG